jgi:hypothetical protein
LTGALHLHSNISKPVIWLTVDCKVFWNNRWIKHA